MNKIILIVGISLVALVSVLIGGNMGVFLPIINYNNSDNISLPENKVLNLSNQKLTSIPLYVFDLVNIEELNVSNNSLSGAIQSQIGQLVNLKVLNISNNLMTGVPAEIGKLQNLEFLDLSNNKLTGLPNELGNLKNLKTLNLSGNLYSQQDLDKIRGSLQNTNFILE